MQIIVKREEQEHGPYTLDEITEYLASGNVVGDDVARADGTAEWKTVNALVAQARAREMTDKAVAGAKALAAKSSEAALGGIRSLTAKGSEAAVTGFVMATDPDTGVKARYSRLSQKQRGLLLIALILVGYALIQVVSSPSPAGIASQIIKGTLQSPSSFSLVESNEKWSGKDTKGRNAYIYRIDFDAKNGLGATIRSCRLVAFSTRGNDFYTTPGTEIDGCDSSGLGITEDQMIEVLVNVNFRK